MGVSKYWIKMVITHEILVRWKLKIGDGEDGGYVVVYFFKSKIIYTYTQKYTIFQQPKIFFSSIFDHEKYWKYIGKLYLIIGFFQFFFSNKFPLKNLVVAVT